MEGALCTHVAFGLLYLGWQTTAVGSVLLAVGTSAIAAGGEGIP